MDTLMQEALYEVRDNMMLAINATEKAVKISKANTAMHLLDALLTSELINELPSWQYLDLIKVSNGLETFLTHLLEKASK
jgi:hypothetical protein